MTEQSNDGCINFKCIHDYIYKQCGHDSSLAWQCVAQAWLKVDQTRPINEQASFMYRAARGYMFDEFKHRRKYISESSLGKVEDEHQTLSKVMLDSATTDDEPPQETQLIQYALETAEPDMVKPLILVMSKIFDNYFRQTLYVEGIRQLLKNTNYYGNCQVMARRILNHLQQVFGDRL